MPLMDKLLVMQLSPTAAEAGLSHLATATGLSISRHRHPAEQSSEQSEPRLHDVAHRGVTPLTKTE